MSTKPAVPVTMALLDPVQGRLESITPAASAEAIDPWRGHYADAGFDIVRPSIDTLKWLRFYEISDTFPPVMDAFCSLTEGTGFDVKEVHMRGGDKPIEASEEEREDQHAVVFDILQRLSPDNAEEMFKTSMRHLNCTGYRGFEVVRTKAAKGTISPNPRGEFAFLHHVSSALLRATFRDKAPRRVPWYRRDPKTGKMVKSYRYKHLRRWVKIDPLSHNRVWFSEWGDPQLIHRDTGKVLRYADGKLAEGVTEEMVTIGHANCVVANEIIVEVWSEDPLESPYGIAPMTAVGFPLEGNIEAAGANYLAFKRGFRFPFLVIVEGGFIEEKDLERMKEKLMAHAGTKNFHEPILLEGSADEDTSKGGFGAPGTAGTVKIRIEKMHDTFDRDHTHEGYQERNSRLVGQRWRLPGVFFGKTGDEFTFATIWASLWMFENTVAPPERRRSDDIINRRILPEAGVYLWQVRSKGISMSELGEVTALLKALMDHGVVSPDEARSIAADAAKIRLDSLPEEMGEWASRPMGAPSQSSSANDEEGGQSEAEIDEHERAMVRLAAAREAVEARMRRQLPPTREERQRLGLVG